MRRVAALNCTLLNEDTYGQYFLPVSVERKLRTERDSEIFDTFIGLFRILSRSVIGCKLGWRSLGGQNHGVCTQKLGVRLLTIGVKFSMLELRLVS